MNPDQLLLRTCEADRTVVPVRTSMFAEKLRVAIARVDRETRSVTLSFSPDEFFVQAMNVIQGGAVAGMLDFALAFAVLVELPDGHSAASTSLTVSFVKAAAPGPLVAVSTVDHVGRTSAFARGTLTRPDGTIVATASSPLSVIAPRNCRG